MNAVRDNLTFLKGALDLLTNGTTADTGATTYFNITREAASDSVFRSAVTGDAHARYIINAGGGMVWGAGADTGDVNLYRLSAGLLATDYMLQAVMGVATKTKAGAISDGDWTSAPPVGTLAVDTSGLKIYVRTGAATWKTVTIA